ncbi:MAG: GatB/YqeY domain-containing protein [Flavobacteriales bacterium]
MLDINKEIKQAMLDKDSVKLASLRAVKSAVIMAQTEKGASEMDEAGMQKIIQKQVKQRKDAAQIYIDQSRQDLADDEIAQIKILEKFLPKQMDESEIKTIVEEVISSTGATSMADMGKVMGLVNQKLAGKADGKIIAQIVKATLA